MAESGKRDAERAGRGTRDGQHVALIRDRLREGILRGEFSAGEATSQVELAARLGVSRSPLREAMRMLQEEGLIISQPNRRVRIADVWAEDLDELYALRVVVEVAALRITIPQLTREDHAELEGLLAQIDHYHEQDDFDRLNVPHRAFHLKLTSGVGTRTSELIGQYFDHALRYRRIYNATLEARPWDESRQQHRAILDAVERGDAESATVFLAEHYASTACHVAMQVDPERPPQKLLTVLESLGAAAPLWR